MHRQHATLTFPTTDTRTSNTLLNDAPKVWTKDRLANFSNEIYSHQAFKNPNFIGKMSIPPTRSDEGVRACLTKARALYKKGLYDTYIF